jgi:hypothetical protein
MSAHPTRSAHVAAVIGGLSALPFFTANAIVAQRIEPFFSVIRPGPHTSTFELVLLAVVLLCPPGRGLRRRPAAVRLEHAASQRLDRQRHHQRRSAGGVRRDLDGARRRDLPLRGARHSELRLKGYRLFQYAFCPT